MIILLANTLVALVGSGLLALALPLSRGLRVVACLLIGQAWITAVLLVTGAGLGRLDGASITAVNLVVAAIAWLASRPSTRGRPETAARVRTMIGSALRRAPSLIREQPAVAVVAIVVGGALAWKLIEAVRLPVLDFDGFSYHLVTVDVWLQSGAIGRVPQRIWSDGYPANGELVTLWLMAFTRSDVLANLTAMSAVPLAMAATAGLARTLGASRSRAILVGLMIAGTPAVLALSASTYVDIWAMADIAAVACFGAVAVRSRWPDARVPIVLTGVAIGLAVGTKLSMAVPGAAIALAIVLAGAVRVGPGASRLWPAVRNGLLVGLPAVVLGGYWYAKNLLVFGNPFWPFDVGPFHGLGDFRLITQTPDEFVGLPAFVAILRSWFADIGLRSYDYDNRIGGFGVVWSLCLVLAVVGFARSRPALRPYVALVAAAMALTVLTMPMGWWPRYTLFLVVLVGALAAVGLTRLPRRPAAVLVSAVVVLTSWSTLVTTWRSNFAPINDKPALVPVAMVRLMAGDGPLRTDLGLWARCATVTGLPAGSVVAADGFNLIHATVGHELERRALPPIAMSADPAVLYQHLRDAGATHVVLGPASRGLGAAEGRPDLFAALGTTCRDAHVFALVSSGG
ncbi:MAG TPA: hypothetical protein VHM48_10795 [Candidatus Limnocylindrales bacterium]|nr:hypothetical protein [Candidatus Limnocylindrales bacterium]